MYLHTYIHTYIDPMKVLVKLLKENGITNIRTITFSSGKGRTHRWGLAWSFGDQGIDELQRGAHNVLSKKRKNTWSKPVGNDDVTDDAGDNRSKKMLNRKEKRKLMFNVFSENAPSNRNDNSHL